MCKNYQQIHPNMDYETGERCPDSETGELPPLGNLNSETGELEVYQKAPDANNKKRFRIPSTYIAADELEIEDGQDAGITKRIIFTNTHPFSPVVLYLLPTIVIFLPIVTIPLAIVEIILHVWAHRKNNFLKNNNINNFYYQSPMHIYVSQFCGACKYESSKEMIGKLQDKWNRRFVKYGIEYVKQVM